MTEPTRSPAVGLVQIAYEPLEMELKNLGCSSLALLILMLLFYTIARELSILPGDFKNTLRTGRFALWCWWLVYVLKERRAAARRWRRNTG
jgi:hypothetical protein